MITPIELRVSLALITTAFSILALLYYKKTREKIPKVWKETGRVTGLFLYPLKSGRRVALNQAEFSEFGASLKVTKGEEGYPLRDRELIAYDGETKHFKTAREYGKILFVEITLEGNSFVLSAPDFKTIYVKRPTRENARVVTITCTYGENICGVDCGEEAANWLSEYVLGQNSGLRLAYHDELFQRDIEQAHSDILPFYKFLKNKYAGLFSNLCSCHLINETTIEDLNKRLKDCNVTAHNFRPNIIVDSDPYAEDNWKWVKIGDVIFRLIKPATRCILTTVDPETGVKNNKGEPLTTLRKYHFLEDANLRKVEKFSPIMGINLAVIKSGQINVGDKIYVAEESTIKVATK